KSMLQASYELYVAAKLWNCRGRTGGSRGKTHFSFLHVSPVENAIVNIYEKISEGILAALKMIAQFPLVFPCLRLYNTSIQGSP
ncbi:MAG: hypothetical protein LUE90_07275, partial [Clostridiales bacterium]|nr:hypothetical protein [Clostridiales bacterium]